MVLPDPAVHIVLGTSSRPFSTCPPLPPPSKVLPPMRPVIVWFRGHDLRVHDQVALDAAVATERPVVALYVLERGAETDGLAESYHMHTSRRSWGPLSPNGGFALGRVQRWWLHHSLKALTTQLDKLGIVLILRRVDSAEATADQVEDVAASLNAAGVFWNKRHKPRAYPVDRDVKDRLAGRDMVAKGFWSETLMRPELGERGQYNDFQSYTRFWIDAVRSAPPARPRRPIHKHNVRAMPEDQVRHLLETKSPYLLAAMCVDNSSGSTWGLHRALPQVDDLELLDGLDVEGDNSPGDVSKIGCAAATDTLATFLSTKRFARFSSGEARRDGMVTGDNLATSRMSPHVRFGEISPRVLFYAVVDAGAQRKLDGDEHGLESARTFLKNMSLREFGYYMLARYPSAATQPIMPEFEAFPWRADDEGELSEAWETGTTGFPIVDAAMRQLLREGWIHNRMRFLVASFFCKYLLLPWPVGAAHMVRTLVDGDEACNSLGWQWTAGCNSDSFPFSTLVNPLSLHNHTQSTKRAADYVRKYVPELSNLPENLIFMPWKATEAERRKYGLEITNRNAYRKLERMSNRCVHNGFRHGIYPTRIVNGPEARRRARYSMDVMRRIFAAQKQIRTLVVDQTVGSDGNCVVHFHQGKSHPTKMVVEENGEEIQQVDATASFVTFPENNTPSSIMKSQPSRKRVTRMQQVVSGPRKKMRLETSEDNESFVTMNTSNEVMSVSNIAGSVGTAEISSGEVGLLLHSSQSGVENDETRRNLHTRSDSTKQVKTTRQDTSTKSQVDCIAERTAKRPRTVSSTTNASSAAKLSVEALLTSAQGSLEGNKKPSGQWKFNSTPKFPNSMPKSEEQARLQPPVPESPALPAHFNPPNVSTPSLQSPLFLSNTLPSQPSFLHDISPCVTPHVKPPTQRLSQGGNRFQPATPPMPFTNSLDATPSMSIHQQSPLCQEMNVRDPRMLRTPVPHQVHSTGHVGSHVGTQAPFGMGRGSGPPMFHGLPQLQMITSPFQQQASPNAQMMVPMRTANALGIHPVPHAAGTLHGQEGQPQMFALPTINGHQQASPPMIVYPAMSPYMDMRLGTMPGAGQTMMHPMLHQHPTGMSVGFTRTETVNGRGRSGRDIDNIPPGGPRNPMEREAIARKMAAMNYYDEQYGGKHWEQWQKIALHLLDQYEFSEDTDRETSKAYVRLCVLKDELRTANPGGPRVTVNHCKEVFQILRLPVTGEWDRRGHGGVRGPYCYGCVKRGSVQK